MGSLGDLNFPQDVIEEILKRLPVRSLLRCRCVSRSWRSTIDDPRFVAVHLNHSALDSSNWFLVCMDLPNPSQLVCSLLPSNSLTLSSRSQIEIPFRTPSELSFIRGSCNGLICVKVISLNCRAQSIYLWNLFTRKYKAVRRFSTESDGVKIFTDDEALAFGFDARSKDYKIVRILNNKNKAEIYSLGADSWRSLECDVPDLYTHIPSIFVNGNIHWLSNDLSKYMGGSIILFDLASEVFDEMSLPEELLLIIEANRPKMSLTVLNYSLALCTWKVLWHRSVCSVWVMREYRVLESWTKLYSFEAPGQVCCFDGFTWNNELLMHIPGHVSYSWNPVTGQFAILPQSMGWDWVNVVESLVSL